MHFIDRDIFTEAPTVQLAAYHAVEQSKWIAYKQYLADKTLPTVNKPQGKWTEDVIRDPLIKLFSSNCAYCGDYAQKNNDGEVDHFYPKELDATADNIYSWDNYVWACHSCNNKKNTNHPLINPCNKTEMDEVYFHAADGRYLIYNKATQDIKDKFNLTEEKTYMNGKMAPQRRRNLARQLHTIYLSEISLLKNLLAAELAVDPDSPDSQAASNKLNESIQNLKDFLESLDFIWLKKQLISEFNNSTPNFNYQYEDFV